MRVLAESIEQGQQTIHREFRAAVHRYINIYRTSSIELRDTREQCTLVVSDYAEIPFFEIFYSGNFVYWKIYITFAKFSNGKYFKLVNNIQTKRELWRNREG